MAEDLDITQETLNSLGEKLNAFGEGLSDDERVVLGMVVAAGMHVVGGSEVEPFFEKQMQIESWSLVGDPIARYHLTNAWPKKIEIGGMKAGDG